MLDPREWLDRAKILSVGEKVRVQHSCGEGSALLLERKPNGYSAWCHRCAESGWVPVESMSLSERLALREAQRAADAALERTLTLPQPANFNIAEWPLASRVWLYKAGLLNSDIESLGFYYHKGTDRIVLPVFYKGALVYWQARSEDKSKPKYINPVVPRDRIYGWFPQDPTDVSRVVLTEDYLSAFRVWGATGVTTCALFGLRVSDFLMTKLLAADEVIVWLDPDWEVPGRPGQAAAAKLVKQLTAYGINCRNIVSSADPKKLSNDEIQEAL